MKKIYAALALLLTNQAQAEGIVDLTPYVSINSTYDDNVFRYSSPDQAEQQFGSRKTSDLIKRIELGLDAKLRFSRQLFSLTSNISDSKYNRFTLLNNRGNSYHLVWSYELGNHIQGELSTSENNSLAGFNEFRTTEKNIRTVSQQTASINWSFHPDWTLFSVAQKNGLENDQDSFKAINREDDVYVAGIRYANARNTQLGLSYQLTNTQFPNRLGFAKIFFGDTTQRRELAMSANWMPTQRINIGARVSKVDLNYDNVPERNFDAVAQQLSLNYQITNKAQLQISAYQNVGPIDDVISTYVKSRGINITPSWRPTDKLFLNANVGYETRDYLGSAGFFDVNEGNRNDSSILSSLGLRYIPLERLSIALDFNSEDRSSNITNFDYAFKQVSLNMRFDF